MTLRIYTQEKFTASVGKGVKPWNANSIYINRLEKIIDTKKTLSSPRTVGQKIRKI